MRCLGKADPHDHSNAGPAQGLTGGGKGRAGGGHIVHKPDPLGDGFASPTAGKGAGDILLAESGVESGLGAGIEDTHEPVRLQGAAVQESNLPGHEGRGIKSASPKAPGVERHWDDSIRRQDRGSPSRRPGQQARDSQGSGVESCQAARRILEAVNPGSPFAPHGDCGDDRPEPRVGRLGKGNGSQPGKRRLAAWAENFSRARSSAAGAMAGQEKIKQVVRIQREGLRGTGPDRLGLVGL